MKKNYLSVAKGVWLALLGLGLLVGQRAGAQAIPDAQWSRIGNSVAVTSDGNIVVSDEMAHVVKYDLQGNQIWRTGPLPGASYIAGKIPTNCPCVGGYAVVTNIDLLAPLPNGSVVLAGQEWGGAGIHNTINASGTAPGTSQYGEAKDDMINTPDGGTVYLNTLSPSSTKTMVSIQKTGATSWSWAIAYPTANPDQSVTKGEAVLNTPDGGYLVVGYHNTTGALTDLNNSTSLDNTGWIAKLDGQGNVIWQKLLSALPVTNTSSGPVGGSVVRMLTINDVIPAADGNGYALVGTALTPSSHQPATAVTALVEVDGNGDFKRARSVNPQPTKAFITSYTDPNGLNYYVVGNTSRTNGADPQVTKVSTANVGTSDPGLFAVIAQRTFDGPSDGFLKGITRAGDGSLVLISSNLQVIKLRVETPPTLYPLQMIAPSYNCPTGQITFNVSGGDGSAVTFISPGIQRNSPTDRFGTVEAGLRNDPKVITITAIQNGVSVSVDFDLKAACSTTGLLSPRASTIPDASFKVWESVYIPVGTYFSDPNFGSNPNYRSNWNISASGLPPGMGLSAKISELPFTPAVVLVGTASTVGVYNVTISASTSGGSVSTTFKITVSTTNPPPPPSGSFALTQPTYNCQTGAITFNTSGSDGSPTTYSAPGIARASVTDNFGVVESGLRNDPKPITITAMQSGKTATYTFDFGAYCTGTPPPPPPPPTGSALSLLAPTYDCATGAFRFNTSGGDGTSIEYFAPGITGWTTNPNQFVDKDSRTASDVAPFTLMARQSGVTVNYVWNLKTACNRAREGVQEIGTKLQVRVLGNPITGSAAEVEINGVSGQAVRLALVNQQGSILHQQLIGQAGAQEQVQVPLTGSNGVFLIRVQTAREQQTVRVIKP
ncbi:hypothetical protein GCM10028807_30350 [Spirosoma daeguense]